jgi:uncharacterized protein
MKKISVFRDRFLVLSFLFSASVLSGQISDDSLRIYYDTIAKYRTGKNIRLMYAESSPLTTEQQRIFKGLNYYPANPEFRFEAIVVKEYEPISVFLKTTTDRMPEYLKYGEVVFTIGSNEFHLTAYQNKKLLDVLPDENILFIPFRDATTGIETYEGGRYVECEVPDDGETTILDFNKAYNPYCAYNPGFSCVIPPEENLLPISIEAGEKKFR